MQPGQHSVGIRGMNISWLVSPNFIVTDRRVVIDVAFPSVFGNARTLLLLFYAKCSRGDPLLDHLGALSFPAWRS